MSGFFAASALAISGWKQTALPAQKTGSGHISFPHWFQHCTLGALGAGLVSLFPGLGPSHAAFLGKWIPHTQRGRGFLMLLGGINTANILFSVMFFLLLGKTRTGVAVVLRELGGFSWEQGLAMVGVGIMALGVGALTTLKLGAVMAQNMKTVRRPILRFLVLLFLLAWILAGEGGIGGLVFLTAAGVGVYTHLSGAKKSNLMAFLLAPSIIYYLNVL